LGLWDQFFVAKADCAELGLGSAEPVGDHDGWQYVRLPMDGTISLDEVVQGTARTLAAPVIGAFVADSDAAAIFFAGPSVTSGSLNDQPVLRGCRRRPHAAMA
jgi:hypothetical protein